MPLRPENSRHTFRLLAETAADLILVIEDGETIRYANPAARTVLGYDPADLVGQPLTVIIPERLREAHRAGLGRYLASGERRLDWARLDLSGRCADGTEVPLAISFAEYTLEGAHHFTAIIRDISEAKRAEAALLESQRALQALNATLEAQVAERTSRTRVLSARLAVAQQEERRRIAHLLHDDLQQHLFALSMLVDRCERAPEGEDRAHAFDRARTTLDAAVRLTRSLATDLSPAVLASGTLGDLLEWLAQKKREDLGLTVEVDAAADVAQPALRVFLYHLVREALFNVFKHAGTDRAKVTVHALDDGSVAVRVEDDGVGFDPTEAMGRQGFGLASIRERLELVGGRLDVASAPGAGTRLTLVLPRDGLVGVA